MIVRRHLLVLPAALAAAPSCAQQREAAQPVAATAPALSIGPAGLTQGGLAFGQAAPGTRLTLDGKPVHVGADGRFVLGFGRDAAATARLVATAPDGRVARQELAIARRQWDVQRLNGLPGNMVNPNAQQMARITAERQRLVAIRAVDSDLPYYAEPFIRPAQGRISGVYGSQRILNGEPRAPHLGLDIAGPTGTPVSAMGGGRVLLAADLYFTGNTIILDHGHGVTSLYAHLSAMNVAEGEAVRQGQRIGAIGATGRVTGPHLHLGVNWLSTAVDPAPLLPAA